MPSNMDGLSTPIAVRLAEYAYGRACMRTSRLPGDSPDFAENPAMLLDAGSLLLDSYSHDGLDLPDRLHRLRVVGERVKRLHLAGEGVREWLDVPDREGAHVVVWDAHGRVLLQHRTHDAPSSAGKWTVPGGRVEPGENAISAPRRELAEETGLHASAFCPLSVAYNWSTRDDSWVRHSFFTTETTATEGDLVLGEGCELRFVRIDQLGQLDFWPPARDAIVAAFARRLALPNQCEDEAWQGT